MCNDSAADAEWRDTDTACQRDADMLNDLHVTNG